MEWLNYHHLLYFHTVAREGSLARASEVLGLSPPTLSGQIRALEASLGEPLFRRTGRRLVLTEMGRVVDGYAAEIFSLGREMREALKGQGTGRPVRLVVGVADVLPKFVVRRLLAPARRLGEPVVLVVHEDHPERLLARLALHALDVVLTDAPVDSSSPVKAFNHLLGECGVVFCGTPKLAARHTRGFPRSLDGAPVVLPTDDTTLRRSLDHWFARIGVRPRIAAEIADSSLLKVMGGDGMGLFPIPAVVETEIRRWLGVRRVGPAEGVRERFYAVTIERRLRNPAVQAICEAARETLFA